MKLTIELAHRRLDEIYQSAKETEYVRKPISYALYHAWKYADTTENPRERQQGELKKL